MRRSSNFAAKTKLTVLFNWFSLKYKTRSLNKLSHDLPEITGSRMPSLVQIRRKLWPVTGNR